MEKTDKNATFVHNIYEFVSFENGLDFSNICSGEKRHSCKIVYSLSETKLFEKYVQFLDSLTMRLSFNHISIHIINIYT